MAFIVLRRSRNTRSYYLVESYRDDQGKTQRRTLCYLGREQDGTDTLAKARAHWEQVMEQAKIELRKARGESRQVIRRRIEATASRIGVIKEHMQLLRRVEAELSKREQQAEEALYWQSFERLRRHPTEENAKAAKRAFLFLAKRYHPDQGGAHHDFLRVKDAYDLIRELKARSPRRPARVHSPARVGTVPLGRRRRPVPVEKNPVPYKDSIGVEAMSE